MPSVIHTEFAARLRQSRTTQVAFARLCSQRAGLAQMRKVERNFRVVTPSR